MRETERNGREIGGKEREGGGSGCAGTLGRRIVRADENVRGKESGGERAERLMVSALNN